MVAERKATVVWEGEMRVGQGTVNSYSGAFAGLKVTFGDRLESEASTTSPEELIAAAHAASYAMVLSNTLSSNGNQPDRLDVTSVCQLARSVDGLTIKRMQLDVKGVVPRLSDEDFQQMAQRAEQRCPVSNAFRGTVEIAVNAELVPAEPAAEPAQEAPSGATDQA